MLNDELIKLKMEYNKLEKSLQIIIKNIEISTAYNDNKYKIFEQVNYLFISIYIYYIKYNNF